MSQFADAQRRAHAMRTARTDAMRRALAHRICFDLLAALRGQHPAAQPTPAKERRS